MIVMGASNFFIRLQIKRSDNGIFINQGKYIKELLNKYGLDRSRYGKTPMAEKL